MEEERKENMPGWLMPLLKAQFYTSCESHGSNCNFYCLDCGKGLGLLVCEGCLNADQHRGHHFLKVYKASHRVAIKVCDINRLIDLSCIQQYINNNTRVVYIRQRGEEEQQSNSNSIPKCERCGWQLLPATTAKFCSIDCKTSFRKRIMCTSKPEPEDMELNSNSNQPPTPTHSSIKKRRKGIPRRAPFF